MENKENLVVRIANQSGLKVMQVKNVLDTLVSIVVDDLQNRRDININNLCKFTVKDILSIDDLDNVKGQIKAKVSTSLVNSVNENYGKKDLDCAVLDQFIQGLNIEAE